jgi:endonuclease/exonuclease/phosphatase family metal-dependent hydrolase
VTAPRQIRIATWNIHGGVGTDGRCDADRIAAVIAELDVDAIGLQEVDARYHPRNDLDQIEHLQAATGMTAVAGATLRSHRGFFGNALLTRHPPTAVRHFDLSARAREPRAALDVELDCGGAPARVIVTHFGLLASERRAQVRGLLEVVRQVPLRPLVVLGDFNEWSLINRTVRLLDSKLGRSAAVRSFPSRLPIFTLDRLWVRPAGALEAVWAHRSPLARVASDHLPVVGRIRAGWPRLEPVRRVEPAELEVDG